MASIDLPPPPLAVLDTNVVLDWLVFCNPVCLALERAIFTRRLSWTGTLAMRDELAHVIGRGVVDAWQPDDKKIWQVWDQWCDAAPTANALTAARLRCTDTDDQKFVDLAMAKAQWLISRDRAVLKLSRAAAKSGLRVVTPERWAQEQSL